MPIAQRYVSPYLTHFVGRRLNGDESRYACLVEIIMSGKLVAPGLSSLELGSLEVGGPEGWIVKTTRTVNFRTPLSGNERYVSSAVCFCDIPEEHIWLHAEKYSQFGLAFQKHFLAGQGARPVWYIPRQALVDQRVGQENERTSAEVFDKAESDFCTRILGLLPKPKPGGAWSSKGDFEKWMEHHVFPFMKFFDLGRNDHDPDNFYMEREWRLVGVATFVLQNIVRVFVPPAFRQRVIADTGLTDRVVRALSGTGRPLPEDDGIGGQERRA
jgi:hypothetical protein